MGCNYGSIKCIGESYRYYILGTVVKKSRSCIYLALRSQSTQRTVNFETNCPVTTCNDYVNLTPNESQHLDELCSSGVLCILKRVEKGADGEQLLNEKHVLEELRGNKTILHMFESFSYEGSFYISTEYLWRDSLYNYISYHGKLDLSLVKSISYKVLMIIETIHKHGWAHRDITSLNLMIDQSGNIKLIDFEFAKRIENGQKMTSYLGTEYSIPPEVYTHNPYGKEIDFWYLGIVIFEMLTELATTTS